MYNINVNIDVAAIGTALVHAYRNIHVSVPATLEATDRDLADLISIMGKCEGDHCFPTQDELESLKRELSSIRQDETALDSASPWSFHAIKQAFLVKARAKRAKVHAMRMAAKAKGRAVFNRMMSGSTRTLTRTITKAAQTLGPIIGIPLTQANEPVPNQPPLGRSSESTLKNPPAIPGDIATNIFSAKQVAPPCCATLLSQLSPDTVSALIPRLSQGIVDAQAKTTTGAETCFHPNEAALAQLVVDLIKVQAKTELILVHDLVPLLTPVNVASTNLTAVPVA